MHLINIVVSNDYSGEGLLFRNIWNNELAEQVEKFDIGD